MSGYSLQLRFWPGLVRARADVEYFMNIALGPPPTKVLRPEPIPGTLIDICIFSGRPFVVENY